MNRTSWLIGAFVLVVAAANLLTSTLKAIPVGFGLTAAAGTVAAGFALALRDDVQRVAGARAAWCAIGLGTAASAVGGAWRIALASAVAFAVSESIDLMIFSRLRAWGHRRAVVISSVGAAPVDSAVFLAVAGLPGSGWPLFSGQVLVKIFWVLPLYLAVREGVNRAVSRQPQFGSRA